MLLLQLCHKMSLPIELNCCLVTKKVLLAFGKYLNEGPKDDAWSHQAQRAEILPHAAASSAYHT